MAILNNNPLVGASGNQGGYNINNSLRFRSSASAYLSRTPASAGNRRAWTWSGWIKRGTLDATMYLFGASSTTGDVVRFLSTNDIQFYFNNGSNGDIRTSQVFRDPSAWYHLVFVCDTANATASNRMRIYVNGSLITAFQSATYPAQNYDTTFNTAVVHNIAGFSPYLDCYLADVNFIDGQALTPSSFGETDTTTGVWKPKAYSGTYGTNGFYLKFSDIATTSGSNAGLGKDFSGNSNYWTTNNISVTAGTTYDAMTDSPTLTSATVANYAILNPLSSVVGTTATITAGNLNVSSSSANRYAVSSIAIPSTGKWYAECTCTANTNDNKGIGAWSSSKNILYTPDGRIYIDGSQVATPATYTTNDVIGVGFDAGVITFYKNNTLQYTSSTLTFADPTFFYNYIFVDSFAWNFGQRPFAYTPPTGYKALNTYNLPTPTILQGNKYMDATLYTGTGSALTITNAGGFRPDLVWVKSRSNAYNNVLNDSVRGSTKLLISNGTDAEQTETQSITSFNSNGFSLGTAGTWNQNASTFVGWQWQAGQGSTSSNTSGSITSTVSVNTTAGFSVVTATAPASGNFTVGHGLGVAPKMVITKTTGGTNNWTVYHSSVVTTVDQYLSLNQTIALSTYSNVWGAALPTPTLLGLGSGQSVNPSVGFVAYCWAEIAGFSRFGSYVANASSDGPFIYTGFRPRWIMFKRTTSATNWYVIDTSISPINASTAGLYPNTADAVSTEGAVDILSNGFKCRVSSGAFNFPSGETFIYAAFAENPFKNSLAR